MLNYKFVQILDYNEVYIYSDQPTTCPICSVRTFILLDLSHTKLQTQIHVCKNCRFEFIIQIDFDTS